MTLDDFGEIMDKLINDNEMQMLITLPEGTIEPEIEDNFGLGPVVRFYILLNFLRTVFREFREILEPSLEEDAIDSILKLVKRDILADEEKA